jgi:hypothetical protein
MMGFGGSGGGNKLGREFGKRFHQFGWLSFRRLAQLQALRV